VYYFSALIVKLLYHTLINGERQRDIIMLADYIEKLYSVLPGCMLYRLTGFYCPACGGTRAFVAFLRGEFVKSFYYHSIVDITALFVLYKLAHFLTFLVLQRMTPGERVNSLQTKTDISLKRYLIVALVFTIIQWIFKNLIVLYFYWM